MSDFLKQLKSKVKDDDTHILADGTQSAEFTGFIDTGSYALNALLSGSIYGGMADNKILALAGDPATGKTFFKLAIEKNFLNQYEDAVAIDYDTESATTKQMYSSRGIDTSRVIISEPTSIQKFRSHLVKIVDTYMETTDRPKMFITLDSLGNLSTEKEIGDIAEGKDTRDMTRAQLVRGAFRVIRLKLAKAKLPMIVTNHTYDVVGCLDETQNIIMSDGNIKNITEIKVGDRVYTPEGNYDVTHLYDYNVDETIKIELEDGKTIYATPNHKFRLQDGTWKRADELTENDDLAIELELYGKAIAELIN